MSTTTLQNVLWAAGFFGHAALLAVLFARSRWRTFPIFTFLIAYQVGVSLALFFISRYASHHAYFLGYWITALGDYIFQVALVFEIARHVFRSTGTWVRDARKDLVLWSATGTVLAAALCFALSPPAVRGLDLWEFRATLFTSLLTCELFVAVSAAANRLALRWRSHVMTLGAGLAAWAVIAVIGDVAHFATGWRKEFHLFDQVRMYVYLGVLLFWVVSFWQPEEQQTSAPPDLDEYILSLHRQVRRDLTVLRKVK